jgi:adenylate kinase family enzyme
MAKNKKILVIGLPGPGKSYLANKLTNILGAER